MDDAQLEKVSTTALAKKYGITSIEMFVRLIHLGLIEKKGDVWSLTNEGVNQGGKFINSKRFGKYIAWPENIAFDIKQNGKLIPSTAIGKKYSLSANKINFVLSELGWVYKGLKGWFTTSQGIRKGGIQDEGTSHRDRRKS